MNTLVRSRLSAAAVTFALVTASVAPLLASAAAPVSITSGPAEGSTSAGPSVTFEFSTGDASSTPLFECSIVDQADTNSFFSCGSPQTYSLPDGSYRFAVRADGDDSTISQRSFVLGSTSAATSTDTATSTATTTDTGSGDTSTSTPTGAPTITISSGPTEGATTTSGDISFVFTVDNASSTMCSLNSSVAWACGSPQGFTALSDGTYNFAIMAGNDTGTTTLTRNFVVASSTATTTETTTTTTDTTTSGGGGSSTPAPTPAPSGGNGNGSIAGGPPTGHTVIPGGDGAVLGASTGEPSTAGNAVIPSVPGSNSTTQFSVPVASAGTQSRAASAASTGSSVSSAATSPSVARSTTSAGTGSAAVGIPNTGTEVSATDTSVTTATTPAEDLGVAPTTSALGAAAAGADAGIPGWVWLVLAGLVLVGIGVWALRQPA